MRWREWRSALRVGGSWRRCLVCIRGRFPEDGEVFWERLGEVEKADVLARRGSRMTEVEIRSGV